MTTDTLQARAKEVIQLPEEATKPRSVRLNDARWQKLKRLGTEWLARQINEAREPK